MSNSLLPSNATPQERALAETIARVSDVPVLARESWNPDLCAVELLPWLAWAFSVDEWDPEWTEAEKRDVIKQSVYVHKHKGTISAISRALRPLGYLIDVIEWFEETPKATPFTFKVIIGTTTKPVEQNIYPKLERLIKSSKNVRSQLAGITVKQEVRGNLYVGSACQVGVSHTIYPYQLTELETPGPLYYAVGQQLIDIVTVRPQP